MYVPAHKLRLDSCRVLPNLHGPALGKSKSPSSSSVSKLTPSGGIAHVVALPAAAAAAAAAARMDVSAVARRLW